MKETPLMFSTDNVIRIVRSLKTQTRRVVKPPPFNQALIPLLVTPNTWGWFKDGRKDLPEGRLFKCPYGGVGDQIWVKETYYNFQCGGDAVLYKANLAWEKEERPAPADGWKSAMFMPKRFARIWLTLSEPCRLERIQDISEEDAIAEGFECEYKDATSLIKFKVLWDSLNKKRGYGWDTNPYVWVIAHNAFGVRLK